VLVQRKRSALDFKTKPQKYLHAVLEYCFDGNLENDFVPQKNTKRKWYHAPWMCQTPFGREPIHGLTFERPAPIGYLAETQKRPCQSWAVGMYNEPGGYTFNEVWKKVYEPEIKPITFPNGTVAFKLLFTEATEDDVPFLKGSPQWKATIARKALPHPSKERTSPKDLRLIQLDVAVRDKRAETTTGWVFGTFQYHDSIEEKNPWKRLMPVCLMYGNDPSLNPDNYKKGDRPKESWVNPDAVATLPKTRPYFGWLDRGNGPVDNFKSSCISCHSTANHPTVPILPGSKDTVERTMLWFRNVRAGEMFGFIGHPLDYSLQMSAGLNNYEHWSDRWAPYFAPIYRAGALPLSSFPRHKLAARGIHLEEYTKHEQDYITKDD
jgi:hypothetical protein